MSINGVNQNTDIQKLLKLMKSNQNGKAGAAKKLAPGMSMNESVFSAAPNNISMVGGNKSAVSTRGTAGTQIAHNVVSANTAKSVSNVSNTNSAAKSSGVQGEEDNKKRIDIGNYDFDNLTSVSDTELTDLKESLTELKDSNIPRFLQNGIDKKLGKVNSELQKRGSHFEAVEDQNKTDKTDKNEKPNEKDGEVSATESKDAGKSAQAATKQTEQSTADMKESASEMKSLDSKMKKDEKTYQKTMKNTQKEIAQNQKTMQKEAANMEKLSAEADVINSEIEQLSAEAENVQPQPQSLTETDTGFGGASGASDEIQAKIQEKSTSLASVQSGIRTSGANLKKVQIATNKKVRILTRTTKSYQKTATKNIKNVQTQQTESNKALEIANKADEYASYAVMGGQATQYLGKGMMAAGTAMCGWPPTASAGAALIKAGGVVEKVGVSVETVGNIGKCAANVTKTAVYAAQGNIAGALTSAGAAVMSGVSGAKGVQEMSKGFQSINQEVGNAAAKAAGKIKDEGSKTAQKLTKLATDNGAEVTKKAATDVAEGVAEGAAEKTGEQVAEKTTEKATTSFSEKLAKGMEFGSFLQSAGSMFGQQTQQVQTQTSVKVSPYRGGHLGRRKI